MTMWPVSPDVNSPDNDDATLIAPVPLPEGIESAQASALSGANESGRAPGNSE